MEVANTLAYYDTATITAIKSFIVQAPDVNLIKLVYTLLSMVQYKIEHLFLEIFSV